MRIGIFSGGGNRFFLGTCSVSEQVYFYMAVSIRALRYRATASPIPRENFLKNKNGVQKESVVK